MALSRSVSTTSLPPVPPPLPTLWALHPDRLLALQSRLADLTPALTLYWDDWQEDDDDEDLEARTPYEIVDGVAQLQLVGPLVKEDGFYAWWLGGTSLSAFAAQCECAATDPAVREVFVRFDSPGGTLEGTPFAAEALRRLAAAKPVSAHIDGACCSAAYWIAAAVPRGKLSANPESDVGNIGIYTIVTDVTAMLAEAGVTRTLVATGKYKGAGSWGVAITPAHEAQFKALVESPFALFQQAVQAGRGLTARQLNEVSEGFVYMAQDAVAQGLVDRVGYLTDGSLPDEHGAAAPSIPPEEPPGDTPDNPERDATATAGDPQPTQEVPLMNEEQKKSLLEKIQGLFNSPGGAASTPPAPAPVPAPAPAPEPAADALALVQQQEHVRTLTAQVVAQTTEIATLMAANQMLLAENNKLAIERLVMGGQITPAQAAAQEKLRALNPVVYDAAMAEAQVLPPFGGGAQPGADPDTLTGLEALKQRGGMDLTQAAAAGSSEHVEQWIEEQNRAGATGNGLMKLKGGK